MNVLLAMVAVVALALIWMAPSLAAAQVDFCSTLMEEHVMVSQYKKYINSHPCQSVGSLTQLLFMCQMNMWINFFSL